MEYIFFVYTNKWMKVLVMDRKTIGWLIKKKGGGEGAAGVVSETTTVSTDYVLGGE